MSTCVAALYAAAGGPPASGTPAQQLVDDWASGGAGSDGFAMVFEDAAGTDAPSIYVKDSGTPANDTDINLTDDWDAFNSFLTYTSPSPKIVRQSDGDLKYCAHNLVTYSEALTNAAWVKSGTPTVTDNQTDYYGNNAGSTITASGNVDTKLQNNVTSSGIIRIGLKIKANSGSGWVMIGTNTQIAWLDVSNVAVGSSSANVTPTIVDLDGTWRQINVIIDGGSTLYRIELVTGNNASVAATGDSVTVCDVMLHNHPADTTYLPTTTAARYALPIQHDSSNNAEGLLVEPAATNLIANSLTLSGGSPFFADISGTTTGPDGVSGSARIFSDDNGGGTGGTRVEYTVSVTGSTTYTFSIYAKQDQLSWVSLRTAGFATAPLTGNTYFNLGTGSLGSVLGDHTARITSIGNGWYRCSITVTTASGETSGKFILSASDGNNDFTVDRDGTSTVFVYQLQLETGSVPTSPIITTGATATRAVDDLNKALTAIEHSATAGTLYAKYVPRSVATSRDIVRLDDGTANEVISIGQTSGAAARLTVTDGGAAQTAPLTSGTVVAAADNKVAASWAANDFAISEGGAAASTDTSGTLPTVTTFDVGAVNGLVKEVLHLPEAMSDGDLASITT